MLNLTYYIPEIWDIGTENGVDIGVARDMFICNLNFGKEIYGGANLDYAKLGAEWRAMPYMEQHRERVEYNAFTQKKNYNTMVKLYAAGNRAAMRK